MSVLKKIKESLKNYFLSSDETIDVEDKLSDSYFPCSVSNIENSKAFSLETIDPEKLK